MRVTGGTVERSLRELLGEIEDEGIRTKALMLLEKVIEEERGLLTSADGSDDWSVVVLGDLHLDPEDMAAHLEARTQLKELLDKELAPKERRRMVCVSMMGCSK